MSEDLKGGCLCGAVRYEISAPPVAVAHCRCNSCRKATGAGHATVMVVPAPAFSVSGTLTAFTSKGGSGNDLERHFCPTCGGRIYSSSPNNPAMRFVQAGSLDEPARVSPSLVIYASEGVAWDTIDPALPSFDTYPPP
jgi:hypothetical protein